MKVLELKKFLEDKDDDADVKIDMVPQFNVSVVPKNEPVAPEAV